MDAEKASSLAEIWDEVIHRIIEKMVALSSPSMTELHRNLREEMALELAKLQLSLGERVVDERLGSRLPDNVDTDNVSKGGRA